MGIFEEQPPSFAVCLRNPYTALNGRSSLEDQMDHKIGAIYTRFYRECGPRKPYPTTTPFFGPKTHAIWCLCYVIHKHHIRLSTPIPVCGPQPLQGLSIVFKRSLPGLRRTSRVDPGSACQPPGRRRCYKEI